MAVSIEDLAREVSRKCLKNASDLLDNKTNWMGDDAKLVRYLVEIAAEANKMIPVARGPIIRVCDSPPLQREDDKKALADAIREILTEEAENRPDLDYT
ncbi:MAG: hypothetical protein HDT15_04390 [Oscillibacter sp.]|nr:hypothetical protein [Oscillibacter sp.]